MNAIRSWDEDKKKTTFEYVLNEYNIIWKYYDRLHDERQRVLDNYMKMIGIPITLIGFWVGIIDTQKFDFQTEICFISMLLLLICIIGHIYFYIYSKETYNVIRYVNRLRKIQEGAREYFVSSEFQDRIMVFERISKKRVISIKIAKVWIMAIINATITSIPYFLIQHCLLEEKYIAICIVISGIDLFLQMGMYFYYVPPEDGRKDIAKGKAIQK